ncbi:hypothetical protein AB0L47_36980 [Streptomyces bobili]|uniref:hypothetical protein n=1 Tax=Streptomyces bobili TaxID=67280 RepID=UPI0034122EF5
MDEPARETVVLLVAAPAHKGRTVDMSRVQSAFSTLSSAHWARGTACAVLEWTEPGDPQILARRVRSVAAAPGHLTLYLAGQLMLHRDHNTLYLALTRARPSNLRSTGFPLHALTSRLRRRPAGSTTVLVDLVTDTEAWRRVRYQGFTLGPGIRLYGVLSPPPSRKGTAAGPYLAAVAEALAGEPSTGASEAHGRALAAASLDGRVLIAQEPLLRPGFVPLDDPEPEAAASVGQDRPVPPEEPADEGPPLADGPILSLAPGEGDDPEPHTAIVAAAQDGRHAEATAAAAVWEEAALRSHGPGSAPAVHWLEVRAEVARLSQDPALSCQLWQAAARVRLDVGHGPAHPDVMAAVDRAQHQFHRIGSAHEAWQLAPEMLSLRRQVPGVQKGALESLDARVEHLEKAVRAAARPG